MDMKLIVGIVVVIVIAVGAAVALHGGEGTKTNNTTNNTSEQGETGGSGSGGAGAGSGGGSSSGSGGSQGGGSGGGTISLEGTWSGTYTGNYGSGGWTWVIKEDSPGHYIGCLRTTGVYDSGGDWMPITIQVEGNQITIGAVGGGGVIFSGTINGDQASGTWRLANNADSGQWSGSKTSSSTELPCMQMGENETTTSPEETTTTQPPEENTTTSGSNLEGCNVIVPSNMSEAYNAAENAVFEVFSDRGVTCGTPMISDNSVVMYYYVSNVDLMNDGYQLAQDLADVLEQNGWNNITVVAYAGTIVVQGGPYDSTLINIGIQFMYYSPDTIAIVMGLNY